MAKETKRSVGPDHPGGRLYELDVVSDPEDSGNPMFEATFQLLSTTEGLSPKERRTLMHVLKGMLSAKSGSNVSPTQRARYHYYVAMCDATVGNFAEATGWLAECVHHLSPDKQPLALAQAEAMLQSTALQAGLVELAMDGAEVVGQVGPRLLEMDLLIEPTSPPDVVDPNHIE